MTNSDTLRVTLIQTELVWEDPTTNRECFSQRLSTLKEDTDLIILPEMFTTGFTMNPENLAERSDGESVRWMQEHAIKYKAAITGSVIIEENGDYFNRLFFVFPDGSYEKYDKKHTFTLAGEDKVYQAGKDRLIVNYKGWRICPLVCYDLRFPVWSRNTDNYDVLIYVANWPSKRVGAWDALLKARAIENMSYAIGVNRIGSDGNDHPYSGHSAVYDALGECISTSPFESDFMETISLERSHLKSHREHLQFLQDRDHFTLT
ncbi:MAG: amidohydrolase [Flavobacteriaceae bacterium]|nr:amidohydrolase [Flavobacteriaceae bacterium]